MEEECTKHYKDSDLQKADNFYDAANSHFCIPTCPCRAGIVIFDIVWFLT